MENPKESGLPQTNVGTFAESTDIVDVFSAIPTIDESTLKKIGITFNTKGDIVKNRQNYIKLLHNDVLTRNALKFNLFNQQIEFIPDNIIPWYRDGINLNESDIRHLKLRFENGYELNISESIGLFEGCLQTVAEEMSYHPVKQLLEKYSNEWDGISRIADFFPKYLGAEKSDYTTEVTRFILKGAVARIFDSGCKFDTALILIDTTQGGGKSTLCRLLALNDEWFCDDIKDFRDKDSYILLLDSWIVELGEMNAISKSKIEDIRSFLSKTADKFRLPFDKRAELYKRHCIFIGTSNDIESLPNDLSGNRRFLPLRCYKAKQQIHALDNEEETRYYIHQLYGEIVHDYLSGDTSLILPKNIEELAEQKRAEFTPEDYRIGIIQDYLENEYFTCVMDIWENALGHTTPPEKFQRNDIAKLLDNKIDGWKRASGDKRKDVKKYKKQRYWERIEQFIPAKETPFN